MYPKKVKNAHTKGGKSTKLVHILINLPFWYSFYVVNGVILVTCSLISALFYLPMSYVWQCASSPTLLILTLSRMTLSKVSFSHILRNDYWDHFDTFGENFDFDTFKNDTFESVLVDAHSLPNLCTYLVLFLSWNIHIIICMARCCKRDQTSLIFVQIVTNLIIYTES